MSEDSGKVELVSSGTPQKEMPPAAAPAGGGGLRRGNARRASAAANAYAIAPEKRQFHWYTPLAWAKDFVKGTVTGFGGGLGTGARKGFKIGLLVAAVAFFAPVVWPGLAVGLAEIGLPLASGATMAAPAFISNGLYALVDGLGYGLAGGLLGGAFGGAMGLATGGAYELKLRGRRERYAEELADRDTMRARQQSQGQNRSDWREYAQAYDRYQDQKFLRWSEFERHNTQINPSAQGGWADRVSQSREMANYERQMR